MKSSIVIAFFLSLNIVAFSQPGSDIYLFDLKMKNGDITLEKGKNITNHKGYDNQPFFHPDNSLLYYTSADTAGKTDLVSYDFKTEKTTRITNTPENEYSPTVTPDKKFLSCIIQRENGAQDLGKYPINGGEPIVIISNLIVGYHAWMDPTTLFLFILGRPMTFRKFNTETGKDTIISENIGRSLHHMPGRNAISFVQKAPSAPWLIKSIDSSGKIETLGPTLPDNEDLAWTPGGMVVMSEGGKLYSVNPGTKSVWTEVKIKSDVPLKGITRLSINSDGNKIALVVEE